MNDDNDGLKLPDICLIGEKNHPENLSRPGIEPGPAAWQARMLPPVPQQWTNTVVIGCNHRLVVILYGCNFMTIVICLTLESKNTLCKSEASIFIRF